MTATPEAVRYGFGENWRRYSAEAGEMELEAATLGLRSLLPGQFNPVGRSFLDIGSGSGLHSVAAHRIGFSPITAVDYDPNSVTTTNALATRFSAPIKAFRDDILNTRLDGQFDVVYSWGVLHHTGDMYRAVEVAKSLVAPGGLLIIAIYVKTPFCGLWTRIKRTYNKSPVLVQEAMLWPYLGVLTAGRFLKHRGAYGVRGMKAIHDARDWLGGYPYESATSTEILLAVTQGGNFSNIALRGTEPRRGLLGTGCGEYVFQRGDDAN